MWPNCNFFDSLAIGRVCILLILRVLYKLKVAELLQNLQFGQIYALNAQYDLRPHRSWQNAYLSS